MKCRVLGGRGWVKDPRGGRRGWLDIDSGGEGSNDMCEGKGYCSRGSCLEIADQADHKTWCLNLIVSPVKKRYY